MSVVRSAGLSIDEVDVGAAPSDVAVHGEPAAVTRQRDRLHRLLDRQVSEDELVVAVVVTDDVPPDALAVLLSRGVAGVRERAAIRRPCDRRPARVGDRVREQLARLDVDDPQCRSLVAADRHAERDQMPVGGGVVPVERGGGVLEQRGRIDQRRRSGRGIGGGAHDQPELRLAAASFEGEDPAAGDSTRRRDRRGQELDEAGVHRGSGWQGLEGVTSSLVLNGDPCQGLGRGGIFEPPVGVGDLVPVKDVDDVAARSDGKGVEPKRAELRQVSLGRSWASCRGSPCSAACRALRFLVFFDIGPTGYRVTTASLSAAAQEASARAGRSVGSR